LCVNKSNLQRHRYWELDTGAPNKGNVHSKLRTRLHKGSYVIKPTWQLVRKLRHFIKGLSYYYTFYTPFCLGLKTNTDLLLWACRGFQNQESSGIGWAVVAFQK
jgi:hypothetical protein